MIHRIEVPAASPPLRGHLPLGDEHLAVTSRHLERDGVPFIPVSAEVHYSRLPRATWDDELRKIRAAGVTVVATYAIWIHHEQVEGRLRFDGSLDLRAFAQLCLKHELELFLRVGPWAHGEARNGGLPDWLLARDLVPRSDDPAYLAEAARWFGAIGEQVRGIPLFAVQVENELYDDAGHIRTLVGLAARAGIRAPLWTGTAWGGAQLPVDEVLPLYAGYSEAFWIAHDAGFDASSASNFYFSDERDEVGVGADTRDSALQPSNLDPSRYPYATCELGGGMVSAYHRRPTAEPADVAALALAKLGSGSTWQGYYMFHDGLNPAPGLQESHATGARNDLPELSYDFNAPLGINGEWRPSFGMLRLQHLALAAFGDRLAPLPLVLPDDAPVVGDTSTLRWAVRGDGSSGFLFVVNHQPHERLPTHRDVTFEVGAVRFPPVDVASGAFFWWPFGFGWRGRTIDWATAQLVTAVGETLVLAETAGVVPRASIDGVPRELEIGVERDGILVLSAEDALRAQLVGEELVLSDALVTPDYEYVQSAEESIPFVAVSPSGPPPPIRLGPWARASAPVEGDWAGAARFRVDVRGLDAASPDVREYLAIDWAGDVARALADGVPVDDRYYTGRPWNLGIDRLGGATEVVIEVLPMRPDAPVYLPTSARERLGDGAARIASVRRGRVRRIPR